MIKVWFLDDNYSDLLSQLRKDDLYQEYPLEYFFSSKVEDVEQIEFKDISNESARDMNFRKVDLLVLDYNLDDTQEGITGAQVLEKLRKRGFDSPVFLYTNYDIRTDDADLDEASLATIRNLRSEINELYVKHRISDTLVKAPGDFRSTLEKIIDMLVEHKGLQKEWFPVTEPAEPPGDAVHDWQGLLDDESSLTFMLPGYRDGNRDINISSRHELGNINDSNIEVLEDFPIRLQLIDHEQGLVFTAGKPQKKREEVCVVENSCLSKNRLPALGWVVRKLLKKVKSDDEYQHYESAFASVHGDDFFVEVHFAVEVPAYLSARLAYLSAIRKSLASYFRLFRSQMHLRVELDAFRAGRVTDRVEYYGFNIVFRNNEPHDQNRLCFDILNDLASGIRPFFQELYLSDLLGPRMVGPSSSHTAGANRLGQLFRKILEGLTNLKGFQNLKVYAAAQLHQSFRDTGPGHGTPSAFCAGLIDGSTEDDDAIAHFSTTEERNILKGPASAAWKGFVSSDVGSGKDIPALPGLDSWHYHENSVALYLWTDIDNERKPELFAEQNPLEADLFIIGESWGGGNVQVRVIGGRLVQNEISACEGKDPDIVLVDTDGNNKYLFMRSDNRIFSGKEKLPWDVDPIYKYPNDLIEKIEDNEKEIGRVIGTPF